MRLLAGLLLLVAVVPPAVAGRGFDTRLRALRGDDRERRREALEEFADGRVLPASKRERARLGRVLERFLSDRRAASERALAVRALGRVGTDDALARVLERLPDERDDRVLAAAEEAFARAASVWAAPALADLERADDPLGRAALLRVLGRLDDPLARETVDRAATGDGHWTVRATAIHAWARRRDPAVVERLIGLLDEEHPGLRAAVLDALRRTTRRSFDGDPAGWRGWWAAEGRHDPLAGPPAPDGPGPKPDAHVYAGEGEEDGARPYFFGIPVSGRRVVFVFDVSASMRSKLPIAYDQLTRAVQGLPPASEFEVIFFNEHVWPWRDRMSRADPVTKELLARHLPTIEIKSYTNLYDSLERALELEPDQVLCISDGEPNRGRRRHARDILEGLRHLNARRVPIHTVSVVRTVDGDDHVDLLRRIADAHRGTHVARTLR